MRDLNKIIVHCSDTRTDQSFTVHDITRWHKARGWSDIGYHYYIDLKGVLHMGRPLKRSGAHVKGHNKDSVGICLEGGKKPDGSKWERPNKNQLEKLAILINFLRNEYGEMTLHGHCEFSSKSCPNFDVCIVEDYL